VLCYVCFKVEVFFLKNLKTPGGKRLRARNEEILSEVNNRAQSASSLILFIVQLANLFTFFFAATFYLCTH
jgi:hypothetical protein